MLSVIEQWCRAHQFTIAAVGAFGTISAVVVSLVVAFMSRSATRTRLRASASMSTIFHKSISPKNRPRYLTVNITNTGMLPLRIPFSFCNWKAPFRRGFYMVNPHDGYGLDPLITQKTYPVEIAPRAAQSFVVTTADALVQEWARLGADSNPLSPWQIRHMRLLIFTDDGLKFRAKIAQSVRDELAKVTTPKAPKAQPAAV